MTAVDISFSPMVEGDLDWVVDNEFALHAVPWTRGNFADSLSAGYSSWVMRRDGQSVGYAVMLRVLDESHLLNLSVARAAQGAGLGGELLGFLFEEARRSGSTQLFLEVRPSNERALALYHGHGFVTVGRRKSYYPVPGGGREDALVMRCDL